MRWRQMPRVMTLLLVTISLACGGAASEPTATPSPTPTEPPTPTATPTPEPTPTLTPEELATYQPNEMGQVMVLMYHGITEDGGEYDRTPDGFRQDLQWLYDNGYYVIPIRDYLTNRISAPPGKRPVVLTFDDGVVSQFRYLVDENGQKTIDPNCAVGILEDFFTRHPDFGRGGLFSILPRAPFAWPDEPEQLEYAEEKLRWLVEHGYEIGNHTLSHANLRELSDEEIKAELAGAVDMIREYVPDAEVEVIALPFGMYPPGGDDTLLRGFTYEGREYRFTGALMVGANPAPSPVDAEFDPFWTPRIQATEEVLAEWFAYAADNPAIMYVSDGNPDTVTIPDTLPEWLAERFMEDRASDKTVIRYPDVADRRGG